MSVNHVQNLKRGYASNWINFTLTFPGQQLCGSFLSLVISYSVHLFHIMHRVTHTPRGK